MRWQPAAHALALFCISGAGIAQSAGSSAKEASVPPPPVPAPVGSETPQGPDNQEPRAEPKQAEPQEEGVAVAASTEESQASVRVHAILAGAKAIAGYQASEFGWGGAGIAAVEWGPSKAWGVQLEAGLVALGGVDQESPQGLAELSGSAGGHVALGLRARPFMVSESMSGAHPFWLSASLGGSFTGGQVAPLLDAFVGYDFAVSDSFSLGPTVGYLLVLQTKDAPRSDNANVLLLGVHGSFGFASSEPKVKDSDLDGIFDPSDACPFEPEDKDGFEDEDGCPELDNDGDKILDPDDACPNLSEDYDDFEDEDGCPDLDNDQDQIPDETDECPLEPEDRDGFEDDNGCPDLDNDQDKIPDIRDLCPMEPEIYNGVADNDGCPDSQSVRVVGDKIELDQKIHFWTNSDRIRGMSYPVIDKLAKFLVDHPEYVRIDIEGHADARGNEKINLSLSTGRAASIMARLVKKGVEKSRLNSEGFGSTRPLVEGTGEHTWFMNRRVEFVVTRNRVVTGDEADDVPPEDAAPALLSDSNEKK